MATLKIIKSAKPVLAVFAMLVFTGFYTSATAQDTVQNTAQERAFDLSHARAALQYFAKPSRTSISHVAFSAPARKLAQFYNSNDYDRGNTAKSTFETTVILLSKAPDTKQLDNVKALLTLIADNGDKQDQCLATALKHLPQSKLENPLYIVWAGGYLKGEDNIISISNVSMLDITDEKYITQPQAIWNDCIHALHHAGMNKINPIPFSLDGISLSDELLAYIEHTILLEGSAHYAVNSTLPPIMFEVSPFDAFTKLQNKLFGGSRTLTSEDWSLVDDMLKSAQYMGSMMARNIDNKLGRPALLNAYNGGAASFFQTYYSIN